VSDQSYIGESADDLGANFLRLRTHEEVSGRAMRRTLAVIAVALLHVLFVFMLIWAEWIPGVHIRTFHEAPLLWLLLPRPAGEPKTVPTKEGKQESHEPRMTYVVPITPPEPSTAINPAYALGQALACGASSFEYLTPEGRARCRRAPWSYKYDKNGVIVLDAAPRPVQEEKPRQSDIQAHERNTADPCAIARMSGTECIDRVIFGNHPP